MTVAREDEVRKGAKDSNHRKEGEQTDGRRQKNTVGNNGTKHVRDLLKAQCATE